MLFLRQWNSFPEGAEEMAQGDISVTYEKSVYKTDV